jgi:penicillin-binding protein 2
LGKRDSWDEILGRTRSRRLIAVIAVIFLILIGRLFYLQAIDHADYVKDAEKNQFQRLRIPAPRGLITDLHGEILVDNVPRFDVVLPWTNESRAKQEIQDICVFLSLDSTVALEQFDAWRKKNAGVPFPVVRDADKLIISAVRENVDLYPRLRVETKARRRYRRGHLASHLLGYVGEVSGEDLSSENLREYQAGDMIGKSGLEYHCENHLRGEHGYQVVQVNAWSTRVGNVGGPSPPPQEGRTVTLTIDARIQAALESRLGREGRAAAVIMDVHSGAIRAAASMPDFDPNVFAVGISQEEWERLNNSKLKPLFSRYYQAAYPPGSTLKIISASVALEKEIVRPQDVLVYCTGAHKFGNRIFRCWKHEGHGWMNFHNGIVQSCDVYFYKIAETMDVDELAEGARAFGLQSRSGFELRGEAQGLVPDRDYYNRRFGKRKWTQGYVLNNIIGQGEFLTNLLQICRLAAAVANGGYLVTPHVIETIDGEAAGEHSKEPVPNLSKQTLTLLQRAMRGVVEEKDGTAYWTRIRGLRAAGKTGTAQNPHGEDHAWFMGYAPADDPQIAITVLIENAGHGGEFASPVARDMYKIYFADILPEEVTRGEAASGGSGDGDAVR